MEAGGLSTLEGQEAALINPTSSQSHDLRAKEQISLERDGETTTLKVAVGTLLRFGDPFPGRTSTGPRQSMMSWRTGLARSLCAHELGRARGR